jgi:glycosyltransferase involved in cell wall biosynthesis
LIDDLTTGGTETQLLALIERLDRGRVQPFLCLLRGADHSSNALELGDIPVLALGVRSFRQPRSLLAAWRLGHFLRRGHIDVLQVYFPESTYFGVPIGRLAGVARVVRTRNNLGYWMTPLHRFLARACNRWTDVLIANCEACRHAVLKDEGISPERVIVLENGVDLGRFPLNRSRAPQVIRRVGAVANLRPIKGVDVFLQGAALLAQENPAIHFTVAGEGSSRSQLQQQISQFGLQDRFFLAGSVANVPAFLDALQVAVLPSRSEGLSNALLEYMAAGKAIVATAVGGNVELIKDGVHGLLVPPNDPVGLAAAIAQLLRNPGLADRLGAAARQRVEQHYSREAMIQRFESFYCNLIRGASSAA